MVLLCPKIHLISNPLLRDSYIFCKLMNKVDLCMSAQVDYVQLVFLIKIWNILSSTNLSRIFVWIGKSKTGL